MMQNKIKDIKALALDVDGTMTDGSIYISGKGFFLTGPHNAVHLFLSMLCQKLQKTVQKISSAFRTSVFF